MQCEAVEIMEDGWSEWIRPVNSKNHNYLLQCCDCGLIHEMEFSLSNGIDDESNNLVFRARRFDANST